MFPEEVQLNSEAAGQIQRGNFILASLRYCAKPQDYSTLNIQSGIQEIEFNHARTAFLRYDCEKQHN